MRHEPDDSATIKVMGKVILELMARVRALERPHHRRKSTAVNDPMIMVESVKGLVRAAAISSGLTEADILGPSRQRFVCTARQWVMFEAQAAGFTLPQIGRVLKRDHTTVLHGIRAERKRRGEI